MKQFILKCAVMATIIASLLLVVWRCPGVSTYELSSVINKMELLDGKRPPRLIFIGGSNLATLDSRRIERECGRPVMNLSLWYGLDYAQFFDELKPRLRPGDIIVFIPEYHVFFTDEVVYLSRESDRILCMIAPWSRVVRSARELKVRECAEDFIDLMQMKSKAFLQNVKAGKWRRLAENGLQDYASYFDDNGDFIAAYPKVRPLGGAGRQFGACALERVLFLNEFYPYARSNDIRVLVSFPPYPLPEYRLNEKAIGSYHRALLSSLRFSVLAAPEDYVLPEERFMDSVYHLDAKGEELRTGRIIRALSGAPGIYKK